MPLEREHSNLSRYVILEQCNLGIFKCSGRGRDYFLLLRVRCFPLAQLAASASAGPVHCAQQHLQRDMTLLEPDLLCSCPWDFLLSRLDLLCKFGLPFSNLTNIRFSSPSRPLVNMSPQASESRKNSDKLMLEARHLFFTVLHFSLKITFFFFWF